MSDAKLIRSASEEIGRERAKALRLQLEERWPGTSPDALSWLEGELAGRLSPPATRFAIAAAVEQVARAIGSDSDRVMTVSALPPEQLDLPAVALSLPFAVRRGGLGRCLLHQAPSELEAVANELRESYDDLLAATSGGGTT